VGDADPGKVRCFAGEAGFDGLPALSAPSMVSMFQVKATMSRRKQRSWIRAGAASISRAARAFEFKPMAILPAGVRSCMVG
jgi:hypothetical protein